MRDLDKDSKVGRERARAGVTETEIGERGKESGDKGGRVEMMNEDGGMGNMTGRNVRGDIPSMPCYEVF